MSQDDIQPVVCSECLVSPDRDFERDGEPWAACPNCGREDRVADIRQAAGEHLATRSFNDTLHRVAEISATVAEGVPEKDLRWITV